MNKLVDTPLIAAEMAPGVVGKNLKHESAHLHVAGEATYTDDIPELAGTLHCALGLSPVAHGKLKGFKLDAIRTMPGVVAVFTHEDVPGTNDVGPILHDDPIFATDTVAYLGQPVFAVLATTREAARRAASSAHVKSALDIEPLTPVLNAREGHAKQQYVIPAMHLSRNTHHADTAAALAAAKRRLTGTLEVGGQ